MCAGAGKDHGGRTDRSSGRSVMHFERAAPDGCPCDAAVVRGRRACEVLRRMFGVVAADRCRAHHDELLDERELDHTG